MSSKRIQEIDALRGLAAIAVVIFHYSCGYQDNYQFIGGEPPFNFRFGYLGVNIFFVLSGFVIFMTLERTERPLDFVFSRVSRLYPAFWVGVLVTTAIVSISQLPDTQRTVPEILMNLTMLQEFFDVRSVEGVYWTLSIELIFYCMMFLTLVFGLLKHTTILAYTWLAFQLAANLIESSYGWFPWTLKYYLITEYCHLFVAGIVFYRIYKGQATKASYGLLAFAAFNQFLVFPRDLPASRFEEGIIGLLFFAVMWAIAKGKATFLSAKPLLFLGGISYSLYLTHQFLGYSIIRFFELRSLPVYGGIACAILASITLATLITNFVEQPLLRWLRSWYSRVRPAPSVCRESEHSNCHNDDATSIGEDGHSPSSSRTATATKPAATR